jgi:hypothetical protein
MRPTFIICERCGQLGNRLALNAQFIALALAHEGRVWNPAFDEYRKYFKTTSRDVFCRYPARRSLLSREAFNGRVCDATLRLAKLIQRRRPRSGVRAIEFPRQATDHVVSRLMFSLDHPAVTELLRSTPIIFFRGYYFYNRTNVVKYAQQIRQYFEPLDRYQENVSQIVTRVRSTSDVLVGVHVRRGDMQSWLGGKYYWDSEQYRQMMAKVKALFPSKRVSFLVCSNDTLLPGDFANLDVVVGTGHLIEDLYALARCDYIIGPHSTYSGWASFYGQVPLFCLKNPAAPISLDGFKVIAEPYSDLSTNLNLRNIDVTESVLADVFLSDIAEGTELNTSPL